ncbi:ABC transporter permease [Staphylococcus epidermidis]|nr:ABC transporter permease [Staphylococcus epidermidis]
MLNIEARINKKAFLQEYGSQLLSKAVEHFYISMFALLLAIVVAVPLGILLSKTQRTANVVLTVAGVLQTIPTLAVLAIMIPIFGVGKTPAIVALFIYVLLPILNNTVLGVKNIDKNVIQAGQSMGMTKFQLMKDVEMPLALPLIISGIRLSSVYVISWATLASYVGAGGLGDLVFNGLNLYQPPMIISAAIVVTLLALVIDFILSLVEKWVVPKGLKVSR